jgi:putative ABC transport system permease protein
LEGLLRIISILVLTASLLGLSTMLLSSLRERSRELALYRAIGARPSFILLIIELEALSLTVISVFMSYLLVVAGLALTQSWLSENFALVIEVWPTAPSIWLYIGGAIAASAALSLIPASIAYSRSLGDVLRSA